MTANPDTDPADGNDNKRLRGRHLARPERSKSRIRTVAEWALFLAVAVILWPQPWGGNLNLVIVAGTSMEPTLESGDLSIMWDSGDYTEGDIVFYQPTLTTGEIYPSHVIHRITGIDDAGSIETTGDNKPGPDPWPVDGDTIKGEHIVTIPEFGMIATNLSRPIAWAAIASLMFIVWAWPKPEDTEPGDEDVDSGTSEGDEGDPDDDSVDVVIDLTSSEQTV